MTKPLPPTRPEVTSTTARASWSTDVLMGRPASELVGLIRNLTAERERLRDSLAKVKAAHDKTRQILGAEVESIEDAAARVAGARDEARKERDREQDSRLMLARSLTRVAEIVGLDPQQCAPGEIYAAVGALYDLRMHVVMALVVEDDDEERTDEQVIARVRELIAVEDAAARVVRERDEVRGRLQRALAHVVAAESESDRLRALLAGAS